jgi:hypothetical protein
MHSVIITTTIIVAVSAVLVVAIRKRNKGNITSKRTKSVEFRLKTKTLP